MKKRLTRCVVTVLFAACVALAHSEPLPAGPSQRTITVEGQALELYTYKPAHYAGGPLLLVLHGLGSNASAYRDYAIPLADRHGFLVAAPLFDRKRFPTWRYQSGGIVRNPENGGVLKTEPEARWTGQLFLAVIDSVRAAEGRPDLGYALIGHSAGGQALSRFAAFTPNTARRIVIANPSTWLWPSSGERFPYGYGGLPPELAGDAALQRYLAQPVTLLLGTADLRRDNNLNTLPPAERQGATRYERGHNAFRAARQLAQERGWTFNWKLIEVPAVGHSARLMFGSPEAAAAFAAD